MSSSEIAVGNVRFDHQAAVDRVIVDVALQEERARTWVPAPSDFKVPNEADQTRNFMIPGFDETDDQQSSQDRREN